MAAYYNEIDPKAAAWLRELIRAGLIAPGVVDERSIVDVRPHELEGYTQCHFFAGIGVWSHALRAAGWPDDRPVWTGSCPCQPFSDAGAKAGLDDERHLWPDWFRLIRECRPGVVFGEQVASKDGLTWLDLVHADMEGEAYTVGAVDTCSAGFGAPHIRQRFFFVAHAASERHDRRRTGEALPRTGAVEEPQRLRNACGLALPGQGGCAVERPARLHDHGQPGDDAARCGEARRMADADGWREGDGGIQRGGQYGLGAKDGLACGLGDTSRRGCGIVGDASLARGGRHADGADEAMRPGPANGFWRAADWLFCTDGDWRPVEPGTFPMAHGIAARLGRLRGYGNAINAEVAREFVGAYMSLMENQMSLRSGDSGGDSPRKGDRT